jgi:glucosylceramidase
MKIQTTLPFLICWTIVATVCTACSSNNSKVMVYVTTNNRSLDFVKDSVSFDKNIDTSSFVIALDTAIRYQSMDGFGAAVTGSTAYNLMQMKPEDRTKFLKETFSDTEGMGQSYIRISIGCSDFSLSEYTCCDTPGIENFALQSEEKDYVIPILQEILAINPNLKIMGSPWTCPRWMKVRDLKTLKPYNSWTSGQLNPNYYQDYATYFVKWIQSMAAEGINIYSVTPQNEPLNRKNSASLFMGWEEQLVFVRDALGPKFKEAGLNTKIYAFDHNYNYDNMTDQEDYPIKIYEDETAASFLAGAAYHNYGGNREELNDINDKRADKELVFTETSIGTWNRGRKLERRLMEDMREVALGTVNNWCKGVIVWNLMLDSDLGPNREDGCRSCYGAVDIDNSDYKTIVRNSHYYIIGHLSAVVKPGAVRIGTTDNTAGGITYSAFVNGDGSYALVLLNETDEEKKITVSDKTRSFSYNIPAKAVTSYHWNKK